MAEKRGIKADILRRARWIYSFFFLIGAAILVQIVYIQYGPEGEELRAKAVASIYERVIIPADRGDLLSHDGRLLSTSIPTYEIRMDFAATGLPDSVFTKEVGALAKALSQFFGDKSAGAYKAKLLHCRQHKQKNRYVLLSPRRVNYMELREIARFPILRRGANRGGLIVEQVNRRILPHGELASRTIGRVNLAGRGTGIEGAFDKELRGEDGNTLTQRISGIFRVPVSDDLNAEPIDGIDVVTTLDVDIQDVAERSLRRQVAEAGADWGTAILMEVATGEIRAIANVTRKGDQLVEDYNYAIGMNLEPGSTLKLASLMALIEDAGMKLTDIVDTGDGEVTFYGARVVDTHRGGHGKITLKEVFEVSSNVGFAKAVNDHYRKHQQRFVDYLYGIGLHDTLPIQIPGAQSPYIMKTSDRYWSRSSLTMMAYGYAYRLTPIQILTLYNAIANNGKMVAPLFVKELRQYGQIVQTYKCSVVRQSVCNSETLAAVRECLEGVVNDGTARVLKSPYYKVAGKTGTAQIAMGRNGYYDNVRGGRHYLGTLVGYFPADNPKYTCIVSIKTFRPDSGKNPYYGASLSGPVFRDIADRVYSSNVSWQRPLSERKSKVPTYPEIKGGNPEEICSILRKLDIPFEKNRERVACEEGVPQWRGDTLHWKSVQPVSGRGIPDVQGMGLRDALFLLERQGLRVSSSGRGTVRGQSIAPGTSVPRGTSVHLVLDLLPKAETVESAATDSLSAT